MVPLKRGQNYRLAVPRTVTSWLVAEEVKLCRSVQLKWTSTIESKPYLSEMPGKTMLTLGLSSKSEYLVVLWIGRTGFQSTG